MEKNILKLELKDYCKILEIYLIKTEHPPNVDYAWEQIKNSLAHIYKMVNKNKDVYCVNCNFNKDCSDKEAMYD